MPRVTIEKEVKVTDGICEIKQYTYNIPEMIIYKGIVLSWDSYHRCYVSRSNSMIVSPEEYIEAKLKERKIKMTKEEKQL